MEKASKWIRNVLIGKKEEKYKMDTSSSIDNKVAESPKVKSRRWSFGRKTSERRRGDTEMHGFSRSFDSSDSVAKLKIQSLMKIHQNIESTAATKIQAAFRSYLARKALHALRGLVKIQALVRGHLVRKQTSATLRGMHALMAIQVRARIHRIQTAEEANLLFRNHSHLHTETSRDKDLFIKDDSKDMSLIEMLEVMESRSGCFDGSETEHVRDSERKNMGYNKEKTLVGDRLCSNRQVSGAPNYLSKTESSRAKARCFSEPKQRPKRGTRHRSKSIESTKELIVALDGRNRRQSLPSTSSSRFSFDHWVMNHYDSLIDATRSDSFNSVMTAAHSYRPNYLAS